MPLADDPSVLEEHAVIRRILSGDKESFRLLVKCHQDVIFSLLMKQIGDRAIAEDLTQETFLKAYLHLRSFRRDARFRSWLTRIALNTAHSYFASKGFRRGRMSESLDPERHAPVGESPDEAVDLAFYQSLLYEVKPKYREVIVLVGLQGHSYEETAELLGVPVGTVRSRLNKARHLLKEAFLLRSRS